MCVAIGANTVTGSTPLWHPRVLGGCLFRRPKRRSRQLFVVVLGLYICG